DELDGAVKDFDPKCRFRGFGAEGISAIVTLRVERYQERLPIVSELVQRLHARFAEAGIEFASGAASTPEKPS
ncbi:MAG: hypothetical protein Q7V62_12005, partial [Actinomycetota bacterium]|nr:hypothetical protein [Actinomycetota bacterium]